MIKPTVPNSVLRAIQKRAHIIDSYHMEDDGFAEEGQGDYAIWIYLKPGWICGFSDTSTIHEATARQAIQAISGAFYSPDIYYQNGADRPMLSPTIPQPPRKGLTPVPTTTTRPRVFGALQAHTPGARLIESTAGRDFTINIEAPKGHHWQGGVHCRPLPPLSDAPYTSRSRYWADVLDEILNYLPPAVRCVDDDCEGVAIHGVCEYWEDQ